VNYIVLIAGAKDETQRMLIKSYDTGLDSCSIMQPHRQLLMRFKKSF